MKLKRFALGLVLSALAGAFVAKAYGQGAKAADPSTSPPTTKAGAGEKAPGNGVQARIQAQLEIKQHLNGLEAALQAIQAEEAKNSGAKSSQALRDAQFDIKQQLDELVASLQAIQAEETKAPLNQASIVEDLNRQAQLYAKQAEEFSKQLQARDQQLKALAGQMGEMNRLQNLPPIEGDVKIFRLAHVPAPDAAKQILSLIGAQAVRVAIDDRTNSLIVFGKPEHVKPVEAILMQLDSQATATEERLALAKPDDTARSRSLMVRVFWLADGLSPDEGQTPEKFLPKSVLDAVARLGLENPLLVTQTVNAILGQEKDVPFESTVPGVLFGQPAHLHLSGSVKLAARDLTTLDLKAHVDGGVRCELVGSMVMPLEHFMVLGTANALAGNQNLGGRRGRGRSGMMGMGRGGMGEGGYGGGFGMEMGGEGDGLPVAAAGGEMGMADAEAMAAAGSAPAPQFSAARFAFVVQVIEAESFEPPAYEMHNAAKKK